MTAEELYTIERRFDQVVKTRKQRFLAMWFNGLISDAELEAALAGLR
jgi:hypothetical protein